MKWELKPGMAMYSEPGTHPVERLVCLEVTETHYVTARVQVIGTGVGEPEERCLSIAAAPLDGLWMRVTQWADVHCANAIYAWFGDMGLDVPKAFRNWYFNDAETIFGDDPYQGMRTR